jgi:hypothetical protein
MRTAGARNEHDMLIKQKKCYVSAYIKVYNKFQQIAQFRTMGLYYPALGRFYQVILSILEVPHAL